MFKRFEDDFILHFYENSCLKQSKCFHSSVNKGATIKWQAHALSFLSNQTEYFFDMFLFFSLCVWFTMFHLLFAISNSIVSFTSYIISKQNHFMWAVCFCRLNFMVLYSIPDCYRGSRSLFCYVNILKSDNMGWKSPLYLWVTEFIEQFRQETTLQPTP